MKVNICSFLLAFALGCNVTAIKIHEIVNGRPITVPCRHSVEGSVTWSRKKNGEKVDLLTSVGGQITRHNDRGKRYGILEDKSLHILKVNISLDTGRYFCKRKQAVDLIPSGTHRLQAAQGIIAFLKCPPDVGGPGVPTWSSDRHGEIKNQIHFYVSTLDKTLAVLDVQPDDSGLYYCDGKPAAYLTVTKEDPSERGEKGRPESSTTATERPAGTTAAFTRLTEAEPMDDDLPDTSYLWQMSVRMAVGILYLIIMMSITVATWRKARRIQTRHRTEA